jgi:hypothetical protein
MENTPENRKKLTGVIAEAWLDNDYKQKLLKDPKAMIMAAGVEIAHKVQVEALEDNEALKNIVLDTHPLPANEVITKLPPNPNFYQVYAYIYTRCIKDADFKKAFLADPAGTITSLGHPIPDYFKIAVYENSENLKYFVLPAPPKAAIKQSLQNEVELFSTDPVNANVNVNANANVNVNGDVNVNGALQVNGAAVATVVVAVAVLI